MSGYPRGQVIDGQKNILQNFPLSALSATGTPSSTTVLHGDGTWNAPYFTAPAPAYDASAVSAHQNALASGTPFSWSSGGGTQGATGIAFIPCASGVMDLGATVTVTWGGVTMTSWGSAYVDNVSTSGWGWVFVLLGVAAGGAGIPGGAQTITVTPTQSGKVFTGFGFSSSYLNVASVGALRTAFGAGGVTNPSLSVTAANTTDIVWGAIHSSGQATTGLSLTTRQSASGGLPFSYTGDTTGSTSVTVNGTSAASWAAFGLDLTPGTSSKIPLSSLSATGTASSATFLRGDGTWNTPTGGAVEPVAPQTGNYTAAAGQLVPCNAASAPFTVTLPTAPADGANVVIKKTDASANAVTYVCGGSDVFNVASGSTSGTLILQYQAVRLQYYATAGIWYVISTDEPLGQLDSRYLPAAISPADFGWGGWSHDIASCFSTGSAPTAGLVNLIALPIRGTQIITNIIMDVTAAGSTLTSGQNFAGLFQNGALLASTADQTTPWQSTGLKVMALSSPQTVNPANGTVYAGVFANGTTRPSFLMAAIGPATWSIVAAASPFKRWTYDSTNTGRTTTFPSTLGTLGTAVATPFWAAWS